MALVAAKCTQCGANIEVDDTKDAGICRSCGTAFITQKAIQNHSTHVTKNITKNIYGREKTEAEEFIANGETFILLGDWENAVKAFTQATVSSPANHKTWLGLVRAETQDFTNLNDNLHKEHLEKACTVANDEEKKIINDTYARYQKLRVEYEERKQPFDKKLRKMRKRFNAYGATSACLVFLIIVLTAVLIPLAADRVISWLAASLPCGIIFSSLCVFLVVWIDSHGKENIQEKKIKALHDEIVNKAKEL